jgi:hypothetical protein
MGFFEDMLTHVGSVVAGIVPAPPAAIRAAVETTSRALLGERAAAERIRALGARSPRVRGLFGVVHRQLMAQPTFHHCLSAAHLHRQPLPPSHPRAHLIRRGVQSTMHAIDDALPGFLQAANTAKRQDAIRHETGRLHGATPGGARHVMAESSHGGRHGPGWRYQRHRHEHPTEVVEPEDVFWGGLEGYGADYLLDEQEELGDVSSPADREPEWEGD